MSLFSFLKSVGEKITGSHEPQAEDIKKNLDSFKLGTENVDVSVDNGKVVLKGQVKDQAAFEKTVLAAGNVQNVDSVDTSGLSVAESAAKPPVFYTVKQGDNLWKIAEAQYGKGNGPKNTLIFEANKPMLTSPDKIYPGQVLRIPPIQ